MGIVIDKEGRIVRHPLPPELTLESADDPAAFAERLATSRVVAVRFLTYDDGRGYSIARLVRERYGFCGEMRAVGEVARDHLYFMRHCGFDSFELRAGEDPREAAAGLVDFSDLYAASTAQPLPLFRRRTP